MLNLEQKLKENTNLKKVKTAICKFYLSNSCNRGVNCEFLHEKLNESRISDCTFLLNGICNKKDCKVRHIIKEVAECQYFKNGYCRDGNECKLQHIKREICINYLIGFCPDGPNCKKFHLKSLISKEQDNIENLVRK